MIYFTCDCRHFALIRLFAERHIPKYRETRRVQWVRVDVERFRAWNVLEHAHRSVLNVVLHHGTVALPFVYVQAGVLENASVSVSALFGTFNEILAYWGQVLFVQAALRLKFELSVREAAALILLHILASLSLQPELAQLCLELVLPLIGYLGRGCRYRCLLGLELGLGDGERSWGRMVYAGRQIEVEMGLFIVRIWRVSGWARKLAVLVWTIVRDLLKVKWLGAVLKLEGGRRGIGQPAGLPSVTGWFERGKLLVGGCLVRWFVCGKEIHVTVCSLPFLFDAGLLVFKVRCAALSNDLLRGERGSLQVDALLG
jgi:hypothetical protein